MGIFNKGRGAKKGESKGAGVQSRRNEPAIPEVQPLDSVNAPKVTSDQAGLANAQQVMADAAQQHYQDQLYKNQQAQAEYNEKYGTANPAQNANSNYLKFEGTAFNETAADERLKNSETFKSMLKRAQDEDAQARQKAESASRYAKAAAWGNMFTALGQLAGAGKNTYVAPDQTYLKSALSKADKARELYDAIQAKNRNAESQYRAAFMDNERKAHMEAEKLRENAYKEYNKLMQSEAKEMRDYGLEMLKLQVEEQYKKGLIDAKTKDREIERIKANAAMKNANTSAAEQTWKETKGNREWQDKEDDKFNKAYTTHTDSVNGYRYAIDEGLARQISDLMIRQGGYTGKDFGLENKYGTLKEGQITLKDIENNSTFKNAVTKFLNDANQKPEVKAEINNLLKAAHRAEYTPTELMSALGNPQFMKELANNPAGVSEIISNMKKSSDPAIKKLLEQWGIKIDEGQEATGSTASSSTTPANSGSWGSFGNKK